MIKGYNGKSNLLAQSSFQQMMSPLLSEEIASTNTQKRFNNIGVIWHLDDDGSIKHYGGNLLGGTVCFSFNPVTNIGKILMTNCDVSASEQTIREFLSVWYTMDKLDEY